MMRTLVDVAVVVRTSIAAIAKAGTPAADCKSSWYPASGLAMGIGGIWLSIGAVWWETMASIAMNIPLMRRLVRMFVATRRYPAAIGNARNPAAAGVDGPWRMAATMGGVLSAMFAIPLTPLEYGAIYSKWLVIYIPLYPSPVRVRANKATTVANRQTVRGFHM